MTSRFPRPVRADWGVLLFAVFVVAGAFLLFALDRIGFAEFVAISSPVTSFYFGRVNGRANGALVVTDSEDPPSR